jgi:hypothetical protein
LNEKVDAPGLEYVYVYFFGNTILDILVGNVNRHTNRPFVKLELIQRDSTCDGSSLVE